MRIGIDARLWNETGVGRYIRNLFHYLPEIDKENEYFWFFRKSEFDKIIMPLPSWHKVLADVRWHSLKEQLILPWIFYKHNLDLMHFPYFSYPLLYPKKFIITIHDLIYDHYKTGKTSTLPTYLYAPKKAAYHLVVWLAVLRAQKIITLSNDSKKEIMKHYRSRTDEISVIYEAGSLERQTSNSSEGFNRLIQRYKPYILYVGNAHPHKNVESLITSMKYIQKQNDNLKLVLVGSDKFFYQKIKTHISKENMGNTVITIGEVPNADLAGWYREAEAFVTASKMEGFGIPPLEAMSFGCPTLVSDIPVFHEIYGDASIYFDQNDPQNIADVILSTLKNKNVTAEIIRKGYQRVRLYSWEKMARTTHHLYESCLGL